MQNMNYYEAEKEEEIDLQELFFELLSHWKSIAVSTILIATIAFFISKFLITPMYESTSALYVMSKSTSITSLADLQIGSNLTQDYMEVVGGRPVLDEVINRLGLEENYKELSAKLKLENPNNSRILKITIKDADPYRAKAIADDIAVVAADFISRKMDQDPPSIIQQGYADGEKVSPSTMKNTAIGGIIGFVLAAGIVIVTYLMNDTIMTPEDVEKKLGMNVLASLPIDEEEYDGSKSSKKKRKKTSSSSSGTTSGYGAIRKSGEDKKNTTQNNVHQKVRVEKAKVENVDLKKTGNVVEKKNEAGKESK